MGHPGRGGRAERSCRHPSKAAGCSGDFQQSRNPPCKTHSPGWPAGTGLNRPLEPAPLGSSHASATLASAACSVISPWAAASGCGNSWATNWAPAAAAVGSQQGHKGQRGPGEATGGKGESTLAGVELPARPTAQLSKHGAGMGWAQPRVPLSRNVSKGERCCVLQVNDCRGVEKQHGKRVLLLGRVR